LRASVTQDVAEGLEKEGRDHDRAGALEEPGQRVPAEEPLEMDVLQVRGQRAQLGFERAGPRDPQVGLG
jgi:hypothetical protein